MPSKRFLFVIIFFALSLFLAGDAYAANWYVRPSGGSGSGTSWTAAWNGLTGINWSSVSCGDTIWVAGGTYAQSLSPAKNCTLGSQLYIRRARSDAAGSTGAAGWSSGYDSTVIQDNSMISFGATTNNYITISGRTTASGGDYGWKINNNRASGDALGIAMWSGANTNHLTFEYMELQGPARANSTSDAWGMRGVNDVPYQGSSSHHTFSHMKIHGWGDGFHINYADNHLFEYIDMYNISAFGGDSHPNLMYIKNSNNGIIRYSKFHDSAASGSGIAFSDGGPFENWQIYGNSFYDMTTNSAVAIGVQRATITGLKMYNNTFSNNYINFYLSGSTCGTGTESKNNIVHGSGGSVACGTTSNNLTTSDSGIFVNRATDELHIVSTIGSGYPRNAGTAIPSYFTTDMDGAIFGADGVWDIGAYEYIASGSQLDTFPPSIPANLATQVVSSSQINLSWTASTDNVGVIGYRIYRNGTQISTSSVSSYSNTGLTASTTYSYTVSAYDAAGNSSSQSTAIQTTTLPASPTSSYEAESCSLIAPMQIVSDTSASGGQYIQTSTSESGTATCSFSVSQADTYKITARVFSPNGGTDSFYFQTDNSPEDIWDLNPTASPSEYNVWREDNLAKRGTGTFDNPQYDPYTINLSSGAHTLALRGRESNARLDYFYLTRIADTTPPSAPQNLSVN